MTQIDQDEAREIIAALRTGVVPPTGLHHFATGLDSLMEVIEEELDFVAQGRAQAKWLRGAFGSGKTFATRLLCARARAKGFATAEIQISINDTPLHHLETVYRRLIERLTTAADGTGAFRSVVDAWIYEVGEEISRLKGITEDDPAFGPAVKARLEEKLSELSTHGPAFAQILGAYQQAMDAGELAVAQGLLAWLAGQPHVDRSITSRAGVKGSVDGQAALAFLRGLLILLRQSGYAGLVVVLDEVETVQLMPGPTREKSLNALRQLLDMIGNKDLPGLYLVVTGTPDFFEGYKGIKALNPLHQRVFTQFGEDPRFDNLRAPQVRLPPFDQERLTEVGQKIRAIFPARNPEHLRARANDAFLSQLTERLTTGFGGKVSVVPRLFLREFTDVLDRIDLNPEFDPLVHYELEIDESELGPEERAAFRASESSTSERAGEAPKPRRLDG